MEEGRGRVKEGEVVGGREKDCSSQQHSVQEELSHQARLTHYGIETATSNLVTVPSLLQQEAGDTISSSNMCDLNVASKI